ncbi:MAG: ADP-forming succinate--CoA ligase subunit beta [Chloroflexi bacterium]|nr:ADP-forming succinate--CoA ligase subunit beta [Chloroflexota bacterium]
MNIHEYQAKELFEKYNINTPRGYVTDNAEEVESIINKLNGKAVVKAQVHAGGRGKVGGVKLVNTSDEGKIIAKNLLGSNLVTHQTNKSGVPIEKLLIAETLDIKKELYVSILIDGDLAAPVFIASTEGGMDIEEVAETRPEKIFRIKCDPLIGLTPYLARDLSYKLNIPESSIKQSTNLFINLYKLFIENDCSLVEINPLIITNKEEIIALDAKINIEDDSLFRHKDLEKLYDPNQLDPLEERAISSNLAYVKLDGGEVGCMVNGAGLAMATMDITKKAGANPANFLDIGGSADQNGIEEAFKIITDDNEVKIILVNLFAGIARSDVVAKGIVNAAKETKSSLPIVVTMRGTNADEGLELLKNSNLNITTASDLFEAAKILTKILPTLGD